MIKTTRNLIFYAFRKAIPINWIAKELDREKTENNKTLCLYQPTSVIHRDARIINFQDNPEKIKIGNNSIIRGELLVNAYGGSIIFGDNSSVGENSRIWSGESVIIGDYVQISHNVNIIDTNTHSLDYVTRQKEYTEIYTKGVLKEKRDIRTAPIVIEDNVWISFNVSILKGVRIGSGSVIAANTFINKDVPPNVLVGGNPARILKQLL